MEAAAYAEAPGPPGPALDKGRETHHVCGMALLREGLDHDAVAEWSVVLDATGIAHDVQPGSDGRLAIVVGDVDAPAASAALGAWEAENRARPGPLASPDYGRSLAGVAAGLAILVFAAGVGVGQVGSLFERGSADASRMLQGEWWRAATALTLHVDLTHVAANAVALGVFLGAVARRLGPALAAWLALAAGFAGNVLTALASRGGHVSIGASTAVFGALGTLSALQVPRRGAWLTLGVGVALLGFLGTGARADLLAHLLGFAAGVMLGLPFRRMAPPRRSLLQPAVALLAVAPVLLAWWRAFAP